MGLLDLLFPKHCVGCRKGGEYICANCFTQISFDTEKICVVCNKFSIDGRTHPVCYRKYTINGTVSAIAYKGIIRKLLYQLKYQPYLTDLIPDLATLCYEALIQKELFVQILKEKPILIPIPLSTKRFQKRGYNQAELLAKELGKLFGLEVYLLLERIKATKPQYGLKREERQQNMSNAFAMKDKRLVINEKLETVILVDDVLTTGSTMQEAAKVLKKNGFREVWGVALAKD